MTTNQSRLVRLSELAHELGRRAALAALNEGREAPHTLTLDLPQEVEGIVGGFLGLFAAYLAAGLPEPESFQIHQAALLLKLQEDRVVDESTCPLCGRLDCHPCPDCGALCCLH